MKYCEKCKQNFPDNQVFCSNCGQQLSAINTSAPSTPVQNPPVTPTPNQSTSDGKKTNTWEPVLITGIGLLIELFLSVYGGLGACVAGVVDAVRLKKQGTCKELPFALTWVLLIISILIFFWWVAA